MPAPPPWLERDPENPKAYHLAGASEEVLTRIFTKYANGTSKADICRVLENEGLNLANSLSPWDTSRVSKLLKDERLLGVPEKGFPPVISAKLFERAQKMSASLQGLRGRKSKSTSNLFQGLVYCGYCGERMEPSQKGSGEKQRYCYTCKVHSDGRCIAPEIGAARLECTVAQILDDNCDERCFVSDPELLAELQEHVEQYRHVLIKNCDSESLYCEFPSGYLNPFEDVASVERAFESLKDLAPEATQLLGELREKLIPFVDHSDDRAEQKGTQRERQELRQFLQQNQIRLSLARHMKLRRTLSIVITFPNHFSLRYFQMHEPEVGFRNTLVTDEVLRSSGEEIHQQLLGYLEPTHAKRLEVALTKRRESWSRRIELIESRISRIHDDLFNDKGDHPVLHSPTKRILNRTLNSQEEVRHFLRDVEELEDLLREHRALHYSQFRKTVDAFEAEEGYDYDSQTRQEKQLMNQFLLDNEARILDMTRVIVEVLDHALKNDFVMFSDKHTVIEKVLNYKCLLKEEKYKHLMGIEITDKRRVMRSWNRYKQRFLQTRHVRFEEEVLRKILDTQYDLTVECIPEISAIKQK